MMDAAQRLFDANQDLARIVALKLLSRLSRRASPDAVHNYALAGLWDAAKRYDPERQVPFRSYAALRIHGAVIDGLREEAEGSRDHPHGILGRAVSLWVRPHQKQQVDLVCHRSHRTAATFEVRDELAVARRVLSWRHRILLRLVFDEGWTPSQAASALGLSYARFRQLMIDACQRMGERLAREECRA